MERQRRKKRKESVFHGGILMEMVYLICKGWIDYKVVNEVHSSVTKKNKEWQKKLPLVVLRAEEIMYSKANSEVEYMNLDTLWDRANEAVNTIIRRDEGTEIGELLPPCVETLY
ncbi:hypothetical protein ACFX13_048221 [Malus domestica]